MAIQGEGFKRKFPRRQFRRSIGCICDGHYTVGDGVEIGEGGMAFHIPQELPVGSDAVVSFQIPNGSFVSVRIEIKTAVKSSEVISGFMIGVSFKNLQFEQKREIRSFVSARSEIEH
jgi:hypothetical protein